MPPPLMLKQPQSLRTGDGWNTVDSEIRFNKSRPFIPQLQMRRLLSKAGRSQHVFGGQDYKNPVSIMIIILFRIIIKTIILILLIITTDEVRLDL